MKSHDDSRYRWKVLALATLTHTFGVAMPTMCMPVLFQEISEDLGLNLVQIGAVWGAGALTGMFSGLISGSIGDRFGARRALSLACILAGIAGASRALSSNFFSLSALVLLSGLLFMMIPANVHKTCGIWFSGRQLGIANGFVSMGMAFGFMTSSMISATVLSPWLGGWRNVLLLYGIVSVLIGIPWWFVRDAPDAGSSLHPGADAATGRAPFRDVVRIRDVWLLGFGILSLGGCIQGTLGYLPLYLRQAGWEGPAADSALATFHGFSLLFTLPITELSARLGSRKIILMAAAVSFTVGVGMLTFVDGAMVWMSVIMTGIFRDGFMAILMTTVTETEGVGPARAGTAVGTVMLFSQIGSFSSPLLGNSLTALGLSVPFAFWAVLAAVAFVAFWLVRGGREKTRPAVVH